LTRCSKKSGALFLALALLSLCLTSQLTEPGLPLDIETYTVSVRIPEGPAGYVNILIPPDAEVTSAELLGSSGVENLRGFKYQGAFNLRCYKFAQMSFAWDVLSANSVIDVEVRVKRNSIPYQPVYSDPISDKIMERLVSWPVSGEISPGLSFGYLEKAADWRGYPLLPVNKNAGYQLPQSNIKYVIITSSAMEPSLNDLLVWKHTQGLEPFVMTTQTIDGMYLGESLQSKTKEFLKDAFNVWHMEYVLIIGGASTLPPISYRGRAAGMDWENRTTDYYYMTLEQSADTYSRDFSSNDARYPLDFPDFVLGRFPSDNATELANMIRKTMSYEQDDNPGEWVRTNLLVAGENAPGGPVWDWATYTANDRPKVSLVYPGTLQQTSGNLTLQALVDTLNQGVGSLSIDAHGDPYGWALGGSESLDYTTVDLLSNTRLPVVFSEGCHTGKWDVPQSVAVKMLGKSTGGAVALVGGSSFTPYGIEVYFSAYNYEMNLPVNQWRLPNADYNVGKAFYYFVSLNGVVEYMDLLGDPSLVLATSRYDKPVTTTTITTTASFQRNDYTLVVNTNASTAGLLFDPNRRLINFTMSGTDGTVGSYVVVIPKALLDGTPVVFVDNLPVASTYTENNTHFLVRFDHMLSAHTVTVGGSNTIPEFPLPSLVAMSAIFMTLILRRRSKRQHKMS